jgi:hypothetical protein
VRLTVSALSAFVEVLVPVTLDKTEWILWTVDAHVASATTVWTPVGVVRLQRAITLTEAHLPNESSEERALRWNTVLIHELSCEVVWIGALVNDWLVKCSLCLSYSINVEGNCRCIGAPVP